MAGAPGGLVRQGFWKVEVELARWLVTGGTGALGGHILRELAGQRLRESLHAMVRRDDEPTAAGHHHVADLSDLAAVRACVLAVKPAYILHTGAVTAVADAARDPALAQRVNVDATRALCEAAEQVGARLLHCSTDLVFDGRQSPYDEESARTPTTDYGRTKADAEDVALIWPSTLVVRLPLMFGFAVTRKVTTFAMQMDALRKGEPLKLFTDEFRAPLWLADAARAMILLAESSHTGLIHVSGAARLSRYDLVQQCAASLGVQDAKLIPVLRSSVPSGEQRPADVVLRDERFRRAFPDFERTTVSRIVFEEIYGGPLPA